MIRLHSVAVCIFSLIFIACITAQSASATETLVGEISETAIAIMDGQNDEAEVLINVSIIDDDDGIVLIWTGLNDKMYMSVASPSEVAGIRAAIAKAQEWAKIAKENGVNIDKEIGQFGANTKAPTIIQFRSVDEGATSLLLLMLTDATDVNRKERLRVGVSLNEAWGRAFLTQLDDALGKIPAEFQKLNSSRDKEHLFQ